MNASRAQALAGWAEADITPPLGFPMGGRGPVFDPAQQVADPLMAQIVVLQDHRRRRLLLVSLDVVGSTPSVADPLRHRLAAIAGTRPEAVVLNYSHTHSSGMCLLDIYPYEGEKPAQLLHYEAMLGNTLCALARRALERLSPVQVYWRNGQSELAINRRRRNEEGITEHRPNRDGYYDPNLWVLELKAVRLPSHSLQLRLPSGCIVPGGMAVHLRRLSRSGADGLARTAGGGNPSPVFPGPGRQRAAQNPRRPG